MDDPSKQMGMLTSAIRGDATSRAFKCKKGRRGGVLFRLRQKVLVAVFEIVFRRAGTAAF